MRSSATLLCLIALSIPQTARSDAGSCTLTLDALSFVSFEDRRILALPAGSTLRFDFGARLSDGSIPFRILPEGVSIAPIRLAAGSAETLTYSLAAPSEGRLWQGDPGGRIEMSVELVADLRGTENDGARRYTLEFTTERAEARAAGAVARVDGMRLNAAARQVQLVGATINAGDAHPEPGAVVYAVLSGRFDRLPE